MMAPDMKIIALLPVRNEAWVLPHSLACLSAFCDIVLVNDQNSEDGSREICRRFPKVVLLESTEQLVCEQARWQLLDAARNYDGFNLLWCTDADELMSPVLARRFVAAHRDGLMPGTVVECMYYHAWERADRYRRDGYPYAPHWKEIGLRDDRHMDYRRTRRLPLHEPRVPLEGASGRLQAADLPVLHLQWLLAERNQMKQAWYRCRELLDESKTPAAINELYSRTLPDPGVRTEAVPAAWVEGITFPDLLIDRIPSWQERDVLAWFEIRSPAFFEPLEIWHIATLRDEFRRRVGRSPRPDRSYVPSWPSRAGQFGRRLVSAARRRLPV
jgi:glycosyltransferase involved in cell wall biosynthesis